MTQTELFPIGDPFPSPVRLSPEETTVYQMLYEAAEAGATCPVNIEIEVETGLSSSSMGPKLVSRLEQKGWVKVERAQKARRVQIMSTGKWTAWPAWHRTGAGRVDRGAHDPSPLIRALDEIGYPTDGLAERLTTLAALSRFGDQLARALALVERRKAGVLTGCADG